MNAYDFQFKKLDGTPLNLVDYRGKTLLIVNTASKCGFTSQYAGLQKLWEQYHSQGLEIIAVPSNDFAHQEPGNAEEITCFIKDHYAITFPVTEKNPVTGAHAHPFYLWLARQTGWLGKPHWNFYKYLITPTGELVTWFSSFTTPDSNKLKKAIEKLL